MNKKLLTLSILVFLFLPLSVHSYDGYVSTDSVETCSESNGDGSLVTPICSNDKVVSAQQNQRNIDYTLNYNSSLGLVDENITITQVFVSFEVDGNSSSRNIDEFVDLVAISNGWSIKDLDGNIVDLTDLNNNFNKQQTNTYRFELIETNGIKKNGGDELLNFRFRTKQATSSSRTNNFFSGEILVQVQNIKILKVKVVESPSGNEQLSSERLLDSTDRSIVSSDRKFLGKKQARFSGENLVTEGKIKFIPSIKVDSNKTISEDFGAQVTFEIIRIGKNEDNDFETSFTLTPNAFGPTSRNPMVLDQNYNLNPDTSIDDNDDIVLDSDSQEGTVLFENDDDYINQLGFTPLDDPFDNPTRSMAMSLEEDPNSGTLSMEYHIIRPNQTISITDDDPLPRLSIQFFDESLSTINIDEESYLPQGSSRFLFSTRLNKDNGLLFSDIDDHKVTFELSIGSDTFGNEFPSAYTLVQVDQSGNSTLSPNATAEVTALGNGNVSLEIILNENSDLGTNWNWADPITTVPNSEAYFVLIPLDDQTITQERKVDIILADSQEPINYLLGNKNLTVFIGDNDRPSVCVDPFEFFNFVTREQYNTDTTLQTNSAFDRYGFFSLFGINKVVSFFRTSINSIGGILTDDANFDVANLDADPDNTWFDYDPEIVYNQVSPDTAFPLIRIQGQDCAGYEGKFVDYYQIINDPSTYDLYTP